MREKTVLVPETKPDGTGVSGTSKVNVNGVSGAVRAEDGVLALNVPENV